MADPKDSYITRLLSLPIVARPAGCSGSLTAAEVAARLRSPQFTDQVCKYVETTTARGRFNEYTGLHDVDTTTTEYTFTRIGDDAFCAHVSHSTSVERGTYDNQDF